MARYTDEFLAAAKHGYEDTDQSMRELARELGIGVTTLSTLAEKHGWAKRSQRRRGLPPARQLLEEMRGLAATSSLPPRSGGEGRQAPIGASRGGGPVHDDGKEPPTPDPPSLRFGGRVSEAAIALATAGDPSPPLATLVEGGEQSAPASAATSDPTALLDSMQQILAQLVAAEQAAPGNGLRSPQSARNLTALIQAMRALKALRGGPAIDTRTIDHDDDMPADIDEFRRELARRIAAFMESRPDDGDAGQDPAVLVEEVR